MKLTAQQDYTVNFVKRCSFLRLHWIGTPGLRPFDIRARHMQVSISQEAFKLGDHRILFRALYECNGTCQIDDTATRTDNAFATANMELHELTGRLKAQRKANCEDGSVGDGEEDKSDEDDEPLRTHDCKAKLLV